MRTSDEVTLSGCLGLKRAPTLTRKAERQTAPNFERGLDTGLMPNARTKPAPRRLVREKQHIVGF